MPSQKTLSGWQMELTLNKSAQIVMGVKYAKDCKIQRVNHISCFFYKLVFTSCKAEQRLQGMELQEKEAQKD